MRWSRFMVTVAAALAGFSCASGTAVSPRGGGIALDEGAAGSSVSLRPGDKLTVSLPGNPTTGFVWKVEAGAEPVLAQEGEAAFKTSSSLLGAGGTFVFTFRAVSPGTGTLRLRYLRPFQPDNPQGKTFQVEVAVAG